MTSWDKMKALINSVPIGKTIRRKELVRRITHCAVNTIDAYRTLLSALGAIDSGGWGIYTILKHPKNDLSLEEARKIAYGNSWESWFIIWWKM